MDCYTGMSKDKLVFVGTLNLVDDLFFTTYNTRVYAINFNRLKG